MRFLKYIFKELINHKRFSILFLLNLSMGLAGFIALDGFKTSLDIAIKKRSKAILGADFGLSSRRPLTEKDHLAVTSHIESQTYRSEIIETYSMVANKNKKSRLIQIKAIQNNFPFFGQLELENQGQVSKAQHKNLKDKNIIWAYPDLLQQLKLKVGDKVYIGESEFIIDDVVINDSAAGVNTTMAPRLYMSLDHLAETQLIRPGSIARYKYLYKIAGSSSSSLQRLRDQVFEALPDNNVRVYTHEDASQQLSRMISRLNDFLGLASLVALFLAALGTGFLFRSYLRKKVKEVAILISLGMGHQKAFYLYFTQVFILGLLSAIVATVFSLLLVPTLTLLTKELLPFALEFTLRPTTIILGLVVGSFGSLFICLPVLIQLKNIKPSLLFVDQHSDISVSKWTQFLTTFPTLLLFWLLAIWLANSWQIGSLFTLMFFLAGVLLSCVAWIIFIKIRPFSQHKFMSLRWAVRNLSRQRFTTFACFVAIGLGALLLNLVPQVRHSLKEELSSPEKSKIPSLFMFDIQEEQVIPFKKILKNNDVELSQISPMIRSKLIKVNGELFDRGKGANAQSLTREEQREMRFRNRGFNLSYREKLSDSERIVEGQGYSGFYDETKGKLPEISLEKRFADRLDLKIGDKLLFDIESIPVEGVVSSIRSIKWTSFQPNFFVQFQPGVLNLAPKTFIATVPALTEEKKYAIQDSIVERLPNISIIDVSQLVGRLQSIMNHMGLALQFMSILCLLAGFMVIYSIANHQSYEKKWDIGLLKTLGANFSDIKGQFLWQFGIISLIASIFGSTISLIVSFLISKLIFENIWTFDLITPLASTIICVTLTLIVTEFAILKSLKTKTIDLFSS